MRRRRRRGQEGAFLFSHDVQVDWMLEMEKNQLTNYLCKERKSWEESVCVCARVLPDEI